MDNKEKEYRFRIDYSHTRCEDIWLKEAELEEKHINYFVGKILKEYQELPEKAKIKFKELLNEK